VTRDDLRIRRLVTLVEEIRRESARAVEPPLRIALAAAVVQNPVAGRFVEDLAELRETLASPLGELLARAAFAALDREVEAYGKGALVGSNGDVEHGSVIIHTLEFGDHLRRVCGGTSYLPSTEKRGAPGTSIDMALKHVHDPTVRSHHQTFEFHVPDAPHPDEIVVIAAFASGGRPHARSGDLASELAAASPGS
jgi:hypothetical protein